MKTFIAASAGMFGVAVVALIRIGPEHPHYEDAVILLALATFVVLVVGFLASELAGVQRLAAEIATTVAKRPSAPKIAVAKVAKSTAPPKIPAPVREPETTTGDITVLRGSHRPLRGRVHCDECVPSQFAETFCQAGFDVTTTSEVGLVGECDEQQLAFSYGERRVLITYDGDFLTLNQQGLPHVGILRLPQGVTPETVLVTYRSVWG